jgi:8-oxo-dGTP pyrophosphatase MutT (NUDIX family)
MQRDHDRRRRSHGTALKFIRPTPDLLGRTHPAPAAGPIAPNASDRATAGIIRVNLDYEQLQRATNPTPDACDAAPAGYRRAAVCLPLFERDTTHLLAIQKTDTEGYHWRNQIALPGGHVAPEDRNDTETALRELNEELGITGNDIVVLGQLGHFRTATSGTDLCVIIGRWNAGTPVRSDDREIARVLEIPLASLVQAHLKQGFRSRAARQIGEALTYPLSDATIWGVTARILHSFIEIVLDHSVIRPTAAR